MEIYINNQLAALKQGSSFDFVAENRYFSGADSYTLAMTFPLKDCPQNIAIFGHINRKDVQAQNLLFDCEIRDKAFVQYGSITVTEINETEVKCQFLEGKSVQNFAVTFDEMYINELELGYPDTSRDHMVCEFPFMKDYRWGQGYLAIPWVNNNTGNIQNKWKAHHTLWADRVQGLSYQAYMWYIVGLIFDKLGYTCNLDSWKYHYKWGALLCCNTLPYAWGIRNWARALPHWTLTEFLEQLELLMNCEFDIDHGTKTIVFSWSSNNFLAGGHVEIDNVVDEFTETPAKAEESKYKAEMERQYAECRHRMWKYMVCPAAIDKMYTFATDVYTRVQFDNMAAMVSALKANYEHLDNYNLTGFPFNRLYYVRDVDMYFAMRIYKRKATWQSTYYLYEMECTMQALNSFCPTDPKAEQAEELKIVPAWLDEVINDNKGVKHLCLFLDCPDMQINDGQNDPDEQANDPEEDKEFFMSDFNSMPCFYAAQDESAKTQEFFDKIYVAFWATYANGSPNLPEEDYNDFIRWPVPVRDRAEVDLDWTVWQNDEFSLRFNDNDSTNLYIKHIDPTRKYTFKWIADTIPNPRAVFHIRGRKYICEKITATFTTEGMSQLLKGDFYPMVEDSDM